MLFYIICVVYNNRISNSKVSKIDNTYVKFFYIDNSSELNIKQENQSFCQDKNFSYIDMNGNKGISKAYNKAISCIEKSDDSWIILLDQDTELPDNLINYYTEAINSNPDKLIFTPIVKNQKGIMSPCKKNKSVFQHISMNELRNISEDFSYINSCMCINSMVFNTLKYDESLFLDYVDHDFVSSFKIKFGHEKIFVIKNLIINQNFSGVTKNSFNSDFNRFKIFKNDYTKYCKKWNIKKYKNSLLKRAFKLCYIHKTISFIKILKGE